MSSITVSLTEEKFLKLQELAARFGLTPEELARLSLEELLTQPDEKFQEAVDYVLAKNAELYRRLA